MDPTTVHKPVLPNEILDFGRATSCLRWIDGTAGGGGHCQLALSQMPAEGKLLAVDRDPSVTQRLEENTPAEFRPRMSILNASYADLPEFLPGTAFETVDAILLDLGLSSDQLASETRGFSFQTSGDLDMRFNPEEGIPAWQWLDRADEKTIADTIFQYGEERFSRRIAKQIVAARKSSPVRTADQLRDLIYRSLPAAVRNASRSPGRGSRIDPATRTFQALRIAVNDELGELKRALAALPNFLNVGGRLLIISFHSLEDRIVKYAFREDERLNIVTKKPVIASEAEMQANPRSRSAKLRLAERV